MEKPKNYQPNGRELLNKEFKNNILQIFFIIITILWLLTSFWVSLSGLWDGMKNPINTITFISGLSLGLFLKLRQSYYLKRGYKINSDCKKCKNKK